MDKLIIKNLEYTYEDDTSHKVLDKVSATFESGKLYSIVGESGSGKTTLISLISALEEIQDGDITFNKESIKDIGLGNFRLKYVNIVFQSFNLITYLTAKENVDIGVDFSGRECSKEYSYKMLQKVGINKSKADRLVLKLSGGEQQRVAIARALASDTPIIVADEPTGNLDEKTEEKVIEIFKELAHEGKIVIIVTHSKNVASHADVVYKMKNGKLS